MKTKSAIQRQAEAKAAAILKELGIHEIPVNVRDIAQAKGVQVVAKPLDVDTSGVIVIKNNQAVIGVNGTHHVHRQRFSIAHELGHYFLHRDEANVFVDTTYTFYRDGDSTEGTYAQEIAANTFAAALLMPSDILTRFLNDKQIDLYDENAVKDLAQKFNVSEQALTLRLTNLGLIDT